MIRPWTDRFVEWAVTFFCAPNRRAANRNWWIFFILTWLLVVNVFCDDYGDILAFGLFLLILDPFIQGLRDRIREYDKTYGRW